MQKLIKKQNKPNFSTENLGGKDMQLTKWTLVIFGLILLVMGIAGLPGVSDMCTEPEWHVILKIITGAIAVVIPFLEKKN